MKDIIISIITKIIQFKARKVTLNKEISRIMKVSNVPNKKLQNEDAWFEKWEKLLPDVDRRWYRIFSRYVGNDINLMPDDVCHFVVERILNPVRYRSFYSDKNMFDRVLSLMFKKPVTPYSFIRNINGIHYDINYNELKDINIVELCKSDRVVVKPSVDSSSGNGVLFFKREGNKFIGGENWTQELSISFLSEYYKSNYVIQEAVRQSSYISQFCSTSVNTIRVQLYRSVTTGDIHVQNMIIRLGKIGSLVDNAHAGGCFIGIDVNSGKLYNEVLNQFGERFESFNNIDFKNNTYVIPNFNAIKGFAKKVGACIPHHHIIALDIMLDEDNNPMLIEYNIDAFGLWLFQFTGNTAFGEFTDEIIDYCMKNKDKVNIKLV